MGISYYQKRLIVVQAQAWAKPGHPYKPTAKELYDICVSARIEEGRLNEKLIATSLASRPYRIMVDGSHKSWCGIFALAMLNRGGLNLGTWDLVYGRIANSPWISRSKDLSKVEIGDVAIMREKADVKEAKDAVNHHVLVTGVDHVTNKMTTMEGNTFGQKIISATKPITGKLGIYEYYSLAEEKLAVSV